MKKSLHIPALLLPVMILAAPPLWTPALRASTPQAGRSADAEARVINYIRDHVRPGQPLVVSELYSTVFTKPDERQALSKLYNAFFRIPLFLAKYQDKYGSPPSLQTISQQFDLRTPGAADVLLRVMESDPRVPKFFERDSKTGEIRHVDVAMIRNDPQFGQAVERQLSGWEGKTAPQFQLAGLDGKPMDLAGLSGKVVLLYVWFTGCPPCMKEAPGLAAIQNEFSGRGFTVVGANADKVLGLDYDDAVRKEYVAREKITFPVVEWTKESDAAYGKISIFPTLFLISRKGEIVHHWVGYVPPDEIRKAFADILN